ncbi:MAG: hypothetical protein GY950_24855 [bacterium]|nr:hypothetical protein [bacterium]
MNDPLTMGVISGLIAALIWQAMGGIFKIITPLALVHTLVVIIIGEECCKSYKSFNDAKKYIWKGVKTSDTIKYFSIRGFPLTQETYELRKAIIACYKPHMVIKAVINDPDGEAAEERAREYSNLGIENERTYLEQIKNSFNSLIDTQQIMPRLKIKLHNNPALFRIVIFDDFCLVGFYTNKLIGLTSPVFVYKKKHTCYSVFDRYFEQAWQKGIERKEKYKFS